MEKLNVPPLNPKTDGQFYINLGHDDQMEVVYYRTNKLKLVLTWIGIVSTIFFLKLIFFWRKDWEVKCICDHSTIYDSDWVLVQNQYRQWFAHRVRIEQTTNMLSNCDHGDGTGPNTVQPICLSVGIKTQKFFRHQKLKYIFNTEYRLFEKLSVSTLRCSYFQLTQGLSATEQNQQRWLFGENAIRVHITPVPVLLITQSLNPFYVFQLFSILLWTAGESYYYYAGCIGFLTIISLTAQIVQQRMMERALKKTVAYTRRCYVWRRDEKEWREVPSESLVPGDIIQIPDCGSAMPCDVVLVSGSCVMNESMLTGESVPVTKVAIQSSANDPYFDIKEHSRHVLFSGTNVIQLRPTDDNEVVRGVVYRTGFSTAKGDLVRSIMFPKPMDFKFTKDSYKYVGFLAALAIVGMVYTIILKVTSGESPKDIIIRALDLVTIVVPPALPAAVTCGIVFAQFRLRKKKIFCISPNTINVCGSLDVFCFDKTGTLTEEGLDILSIRQAKASRFVDDYNATNGNEGIGQQSSIVLAMATCHSLAIINGSLNGDPLDLKMFEFTDWELEETTPGSNFLAASVIVRPKNSSSSASDVGILKQFTFSSKLQRMSVVTRQKREGKKAGGGGDNFTVFAKGSPEMISTLSLKETVPPDFDEILIQYTRQGFRVIALATRTLYENIPEEDVPETLAKIKHMTREEVESDFTFLGLLIMENRLKVETTPVITQLKSANIKTIMVTGDNMLTALSVARGCQMLEHEDQVIMVSVEVTEDGSKPDIFWCPVQLATTEKMQFESNGLEIVNIKEESHYLFAVTGKSWTLLRNHYPELLSKVVVRGAVFARFSPDQKKQLIEELQAVGYYVGMCGDGANDCGALKSAHAGISLSDAEASVASPFTSKEPNITCVPKLIREGRTSLVTSFGIFKYMAGYSMTQFLIVCILTWPVINTTMSDFQFLYEDLILVTTLCFTFCFTGPSETIDRRRPMIGLVALAPFMSLFCSMSLNLGVMIFSYYYTQAQPWYEPIDERDGGGELNHDQTVLFLITLSQFITMAIIFSKGSPYRGSIFTNRIYLLNIILCTICSTLMIFNQWDWWADLLKLKMPPSMAFQAMILGISIIHFFASYLVEMYLVDGLIERLLQSALARCVFGETLRHRLVEAELMDAQNWPPLSKKSFAEVMEMELVVNPSTLQEQEMKEEKKNEMGIDNPGFISNKDEDEVTAADETTVDDIPGLKRHLFSISVNDDDNEGSVGTDMTS